MFRIALVLAAAACLVFSAPSGAEPPSSTADTEMLRWNDSIPGFGGFFYDEAELPTVYLLDPADDGAARETFGEEVQVRQGTWEFRQLAEWKSSLVPLLALPGTVLLDIDEQLNRLYIALDGTAEDREGNRDRLERELIFSGVPREAVVVDETEPADLAQSLTGYFDPIPGGVQIDFDSTFCTLGFNVYLAGAGDLGFITNSHCSRIRGAADGTVYLRPNTSEPFAVEVRDPAYITGFPGCPAGRGCRYSDSLFARYDDPIFGDFGFVARTEFRGPYTGSRSTVQPPFRISLVKTFAAVGSRVNKMGRTTGWTHGPVVRSCVDVNVNLTNVTLLCQHLVRAGSRPGDSGSPVFLAQYAGWPYPLMQSKQLLIEPTGLLWGTSASYMYFSPILNIQAELGRLIFR